MEHGKTGYLFVTSVKEPITGPRLQTIKKVKHVSDSLISNRLYLIKVGTSVFHAFVVSFWPATPNHVARKSKTWPEERKVKPVQEMG